MPFAIRYFHAVRQTVGTASARFNPVCEAGHEFCRSPERIATHLLADRLQKLVEQKLVEKFTITGEPARDAYRLTNKGKSLKPVLEAVAQWGLKNIDGTDAKMRLVGD